MTSLLNPSPSGPAPLKPGFTWTPQDAEAAASVLAEVTDEPREVTILTDEEVVALDGLQNEQLAPTPWLDAQQLTRDDLGGIALRGLIARKMVALGPVLTPEGEPTGDYALTAEATITGTLMLRRTAQTVVRMERTSNAGTRWLLCYAHRDHGVLIEDVDPNGLHVFGATTVAGAAEYLRSIANFADAPGVQTAPLSYTQAEFEALETAPEPFADAEGASTFAVVHHGVDGLESGVVYAGPQKVGLLSPQADGTFVASGITDAHLSHLIADALRGRPSFG